MAERNVEKAKDKVQQQHQVAAIQKLNNHNKNDEKQAKENAISNVAQDDLDTESS